MANIPWQQARHLFVIDPRTGHRIPHVVGADPEKGVLTLYLTTYAPIPMIVVQEGKNVELDYTFITIRDFAGNKDVMKWTCRCAFDLVNRETGLVEHEIEGPPAPLQATDPSAYCRQLVGKAPLPPASAPPPGGASPAQREPEAPPPSSP